MVTRRRCGEEDIVSGGQDKIWPTLVGGAKQLKRGGVLAGGLRGEKRGRVGDNRVDGDEVLDCRGRAFEPSCPVFAFRRSGEGRAERIRTDRREKEG